MKFAKNISKFYVDHAEYFMTDDIGNEVVILVNYSSNTYTLEIRSTNGKITDTKKEANRIAKELLKRKSKKNLTDN